MHKMNEIARAEMTPIGKRMGLIGLFFSIVVFCVTPIVGVLSDADEDVIPLVGFLTLVFAWLIVGICWFLMKDATNIEELVVTKTKVSGRRFNGVPFEFQHREIVAVSHQAWMNRVVLHLYTGQSFCFGWVENLNEVCNAIELCRIMALPTKSSTESKPQLDPRRINEELRSYKQLLDDGIITQEEFDAKKKQLLDL